MNAKATETAASKADQHIIIEGLTREGKPFRPSDWVDRTCSTYARFGTNKKLVYSPYLKPVVKNGTRSLEVNLKLKTSNPEGFDQLIQFANENNLNILDAAGASISIAA
jgi:Protein of unknown function (DUF3579)